MGVRADEKGELEFKVCCGVYISDKEGTKSVHLCKKKKIGVGPYFLIVMLLLTVNTLFPTQ